MLKQKIKGFLLMLPTLFLGMVIIYLAIKFLPKEVYTIMVIMITGLMCFIITIIILIGLFNILSNWWIKGKNLLFKK